MRSTVNSKKEAAYVSSLINVKNSSNDIHSYIASELLIRNKRGILLTQARKFCTEIAVSPSTFTFFTRRIGLSNVKELLYIHNSMIENSEHKPKKIKLNNAYNLAQLINTAHKILLVGVSGASWMNQGFYIQLLRMNKNAIYVANKYEQFGLSKILTSKDLIIVNSISLQHNWMIKLMENTHAQVALISSWAPKHLLNKLALFVEISSKERQDGLRIFTNDAREKTLKFFNKVLDELRENPENLNYLTKSSYRG
ncbi:MULTISPECIES: hypothetical protein [unclassified Mycoplasma]|uniref:hypothetical protein n=1 Tax=unclassified Mycoplasma TaxID=2683645 RepID=UPI00211C295D|nr:MULTISPECIES: hypothetical protein [unclassified Mycoplasma]UUM19529.1 hypothetical protein NPA11_01970 [Mycoplasma sp. 1578d]UUM24449.1 hypothetical protein NPA12_01950 [Mycoplasma sp. 3686d]